MLKHKILVTLFVLSRVLICTYTIQVVALLCLLYMYLVDVLLVMNHQWMVMNHVKKDRQRSCNITLKHVCETVVAM
jgi:hypothetical protein